jgi:predicted MFS family arabinose efflux permease
VILLAMARAQPEERSAVVGTVAAFVDVALAAGAFLLGLAADAIDYQAVFLGGAASAVIGLLLLRAITARPPSVLEPAP